MNYIVLVIIVLLLLLIIVGISYFYKTPSSVKLDYKTIHNVMMNDAYLHRLLMIEVMNGAINNSLKATVSRINNGINIMSKALINSFGDILALRVGSFFIRRNEIIYEYYKALRDAKCPNGICVHIVSASTMKENVNSLDIGNVTLRKLETISRDITDSIATYFNVSEVDNSKIGRPSPKYQRLFNLLSIYDRELINQAKTYYSEQFDLSINHNQGSLEISHHISDEINILMTNVKK